MIEYICTNCKTIFKANPEYAKCCGVLEEFSIEKHSGELISLSNSWISVWEMWKNNKEFRKISDELNQNGSNGAATHINAFIEFLLERYETNNDTNSD